MSTSEILDQLPRLTPAEREAIRSKLDAIEVAAPVTPEERVIAAERIKQYRANPGATVSWSVAEAEIRKKLGS